MRLLVTGGAGYIGSVVASALIDAGHDVTVLDDGVDGAWQVADTSTNGTYLNQESQRLGTDAPRILRDGDRIIIGAY